MSPSKVKDELRIVSPIGALGRGFTEEYVWNAVESGVDAIIVDAGSTDSGPGRLALGKMGAPQAGYWREFEILVRACHLHNVKVLIGSAGGSGSNAFVDHHTNIIKSIVKDKGYRTLKVISIYAEIPKDIVRQKLKAKLISPCGSGIPDLLEHDIDSTNIIVAQMGLEPYLQAMNDNPDFDIIVGGRAYDPAPFAAFCLYHGFDDMGEPTLLPPPCYYLFSRPYLKAYVFLKLIIMYLLIRTELCHGQDYGVWGTVRHTQVQGVSRNCPSQQLRPDPPTARSAVYTHLGCSSPSI